MSLRILLMSSALFACSPIYQIHRKSEPSALAGVDRIKVVIEYSQIRLGDETEEEFLANRDPVVEEKYDEIQDLVNAAFIGALQAALPNVRVVAGEDEADVELVVSMLQMQQGKSIPMIIDIPSYLEARLTWVVKGEPTDEIQVAVQAKNTGSGVLWDGRKRVIIVGGGVTIHGRLRAASAQIAESTASFFRAAQKS
jgi:hypothetical protein